MAELDILGLQIVIAFQSLGDWLITPMRFFTFLGQEEFFILIMPIVYWSINPKLGLRLGILLLLSNGLNGVFKLLFHSPRPYWVDPGVHALATETSFGNPSAHAQNAAAVWGLIASAIHRGWAWAAAILLSILIGVSRIYLGVHFPSHILVGWLIGAVILWVFLRLEGPLTLWLGRQSRRNQALLALVVSLGLIALAASARTTLAGFQTPQMWIDNASRADPEAPAISPLALAGLVSPAGAFFGLAVGAIWLFSKGGFDAGGPVWMRLARYPIGLIGILLIWRGLGVFLPAGEYFLAYILRYLRYALIGFWISALAPLLFMRLWAPIRIKATSI